MGPGHTQDEGHVGDEAVTDPEHGGPGATTLEIAMTVLGHVRQRTEEGPVRID
jgi:hypothetical protein